MAKKQKEVSSGSPSVSNDEIYEHLFDSLNSLYKDKKMAFNLANETAPTDVVDFIDTGCTELNLAISNKVDGGVPVGKIIEIIGWEGSGKSLLAMHILANTQKKGGIAILFDTESAFNRNFAEAIGMDVTKLIYSQPDTLEEAYEAIEHVLTKLKQHRNNDKIVTIVLDSLAGASTKTEIEGNYDKEGWATQKAIINSKAMRKITNIIAKEKACLILTNQLRDKLGGMGFGEQTTTSGGKAVGFHSTVRIRMKSVGKIKDKDDVIQGIQTQAVVFKNRIAPPWREAKFSIHYESGIDNFSSLFDVGVKLKYITSGAWNTLFNPETGEEVTKFRRTDFENVLKDNPAIKDMIIKSMQSMLSFHYKDSDDKELLVQLANENDESDIIPD